MPDRYETNTLPRGSRVTQWLGRPSEELLHNGIRHLSECLECIGAQLHSTGNFIAAVEITLLYRHLHKKFFADDETSTGTGGGLSAVFTALNQLPLAKQNSFFSGVDELQKIVENAVQART